MSCLFTTRTTFDIPVTYVSRLRPSLLAYRDLEHALPHMTYILLSHARGPLTFSFPLFLTFASSGRYLDSSLRSFTSTSVQLSHLNITCNVDGYHYGL